MDPNWNCWRSCLYGTSYIVHHYEEENEDEDRHDLDEIVDISGYPSEEDI
jgi:hypothetical protein